MALLSLLATLTVPTAALAAAGAAPKATMAPPRGLADGQRITIRASGFAPHVAIQVLECSGTEADPPLSARTCDALTLDSSGYTDGAGAYLNTPGDPTGDTSGYRVAVLPSATFKTVSIRCGPDDPCVVYVGEQFTDFTQPHTFVPMSFGGVGAARRDGGSHGVPLAAGVIVVAVLALGAGFLWARRRRARR